MKPGPLRQVSLVIPPEAEPAIGELLERLFGQYPAVYTNADSGVTTASVFLDARSQWSPARRARLLQELARLRRRGLRLAANPLAEQPVRREDWAESWKRHFRPLTIGRDLLIRPSWSRRSAAPDQAVVVLDPGLSFGTGQHPTTRFCLGQLVTFRRRHPAAAFLDVGTGSGILAIAAARLGYQPVTAFDFDPDAVDIARANARQNQVSGRLKITRGDLTAMPEQTRRRYDLVCANLTADLLVNCRRRLLNRVAPGGRLVLAGILAAQFAEVRTAYAQEGLQLVAQRARDEWRSGAFERIPFSQPARYTRPR